MVRYVNFFFKKTSVHLRVVSYHTVTLIWRDMDLARHGNTAKLCRSLIWRDMDLTRHGFGATRKYRDMDLPRHGFSATWTWRDTEIPRHGFAATRILRETDYSLLATGFGATWKYRDIEIHYIFLYPFIMYKDKR